LNTIRVVVADDDDTMRRAMVDVLSAHSGFDVVGEARTGEGLAQLVSRTAAQLVVLDVRMPHGGPAAARALRTEPPHPVVVAVSASHDVPTVTEMLRSGASGFLTKGSLGPAFPEDVARCAQGHVVIAVPHGLQVLRALGERPFDSSGG
jgi:DNA-binding NarL/FixJ family response regulator